MAHHGNQRKNRGVILLLPNERGTDLLIINHIIDSQEDTAGNRKGLGPKNGPFLCLMIKSGSE